MRAEETRMRAETEEARIRAAEAEEARVRAVEALKARCCTIA